MILVVGVITVLAPDAPDAADAVVDVDAVVASELAVNDLGAAIMGLEGVVSVLAAVVALPPLLDLNIYLLHATV